MSIWFRICVLQNSPLNQITQKKRFKSSHSHHSTAALPNWPFPVRKSHRCQNNSETDTPQCNVSSYHSILYNSIKGSMRYVNQLHRVPQRQPHSTKSDTQYIYACSPNTLCVFSFPSSPMAAISVWYVYKQMSFTWFRLPSLQCVVGGTVRKRGMSTVQKGI